MLQLLCPFQQFNELCSFLASQKWNENEREQLIT